MGCSSRTHLKTRHIQSNLRLTQPDASSSSEIGQATVEAAFLIPVLMALLLLLLQPGILLYDRMVMEGAAGQGLRMIATRQDGYVDEGYELVVRSQLEAVPDIDIFHVGEWTIEMEGDAGSQDSVVRISTKVRPLPISSSLMSLTQSLDENGLFTLEVEASGSTQPDWYWE